MKQKINLKMETQIMPQPQLVRTINYFYSQQSSPSQKKKVGKILLSDNGLAKLYGCPANWGGFSFDDSCLTYSCI
jgi:hypothetical protein